MKLLVPSVILGAFVLTMLVSAQRVVVTPRTIAYKRSGANVPDYKREFKVRYPTISGKITPTALRSLRSGIDYWRLFKMNFRENLKDDHWLSSFDYEVKYNNHHILDIWLTTEGVGAYPDSGTKYLVFDLRTGRKLNFSDVFSASKLPRLLSRIRQIMKIKEKKAITESEESLETLKMYREIYPEFHPTPDRLLFKDLEGFSVSESGVTFLYDYGFAHAAEASEPPGDFFIPYSELKLFIRQDGLLARFIR